jgi:hypothetical protein
VAVAADEVSVADVAVASWFAAVVEATVGATVEAMAMVAVLAACSAPSMAGSSVTKSRQPDTSDVIRRA